MDGIDRFVKKFRAITRISSPLYATCDKFSCRYSPKTEMREQLRRQGQEFNLIHHFVILLLILILGEFPKAD